MPSYDMRNKETGEITEYRMSYKVLNEFLEQNPNLEVYHSAENLPQFGDGMRMSVPGVGQPDGRFEREIIGRMKETIPGNTIKAGHKTKMAREW